MDAELKSLGEEAVRHLDRALAVGTEVRHDEIRRAVLAVVALRDRARALHAAEAAARPRLDEANALLSLAYGAQFPLAGIHRDRLERVRDGVRALIDTAG